MLPKSQNNDRDPIGPQDLQLEPEEARCLLIDGLFDCESPPTYWQRYGVECGSGRLRSKSEIWNVDPDQQPNVCVCVCATRSREQV